MKYDSLRESIAASRETAELKCAARRERITEKYSALSDAVDQRSQRVDDDHDREYAATCQQFEARPATAAGGIQSALAGGLGRAREIPRQRRKLETSLFSAAATSSASKSSLRSSPR